MSQPEQFNSIWDALADTPEQAVNLRARAELMQQIAAIITEQP
jgi:predicted XRE-type DNA-binding protein